MENDTLHVATFTSKRLTKVLSAPRILPLGERILIAGKYVVYAEYWDESLLGVHLFFLFVHDLLEYVIHFFLVRLRSDSLLVKLI